MEVKHKRTEVIIELKVTPDEVKELQVALGRMLTHKCEYPDIHMTIEPGWWVNSAVNGLFQGLKHALSILPEEGGGSRG